MWQDAAAVLIALGAALYLARALILGKGESCGGCEKKNPPLIALDSIAPPPVNPAEPGKSNGAASGDQPDKAKNRQEGLPARRPGSTATS